MLPALEGRNHEDFIQNPKVGKKYFALEQDFMHDFCNTIARK